MCFAQNVSNTADKHWYNNRSYNYPNKHLALAIDNTKQEESIINAKHRLPPGVI